MNSDELLQKWFKAPLKSRPSKAFIKTSFSGHPEMVLWDNLEGQGEEGGGKGVQEAGGPQV